MDEKLVVAFRNSYSKSMRAAMVLVLSAVLFAISAGLFFIENRLLPGLIQCLATFGMLFSALKLRSAAQHLRPFIGATAEFQIAASEKA